LRVGREEIVLYTNSYGFPHKSNIIKKYLKNKDKKTAMKRKKLLLILAFRFAAKLWRRKK